MFMYDVLLFYFLFGLQDDLNLHGYRTHLTSQAAPQPLTAAEEELKQIRLNEVQTHHTNQQDSWSEVLSALNLDRHMLY